MQDTCLFTINGNRFYVPTFKLLFYVGVCQLNNLDYEKDGFALHVKGISLSKFNALCKRFAQL